MPFFPPQYLFLYKCGKEHSPDFLKPRRAAYLIAHFPSSKSSMNNTIVAHISVPGAKVTLLLEISRLWIVPPNEDHVWLF